MEEQAAVRWSPEDKTQPGQHSKGQNSDEEEKGLQVLLSTLSTFRSLHFHLRSVAGLFKTGVDPSWGLGRGNQIGAVFKVILKDTFGDHMHLGTYLLTSAASVRIGAVCVLGADHRAR
jgi:hypothetical protein